MQIVCSFLALHIDFDVYLLCVCCEQRIASNGGEGGGEAHSLKEKDRMMKCDEDEKRKFTHTYTCIS